MLSWTLVGFEPTRLERLTLLTCEAVTGTTRPIPDQEGSLLPLGLGHPPEGWSDHIGGVALFDVVWFSDL